jgi:hypothetical protein
MDVDLFINNPHRHRDWVRVGHSGIEYCTRSRRFTHGTHYRAPVIKL